MKLNRKQLRKLILQEAAVGFDASSGGVIFPSQVINNMVDEMMVDGSVGASFDEAAAELFRRLVEETQSTPGEIARHLAKMVLEMKANARTRSYLDR